MSWTRRFAKLFRQERIAGGMASGRVVESFLFEVKASDPGMIALPLLALFMAALLAALPPAIRAVRIDPARTLRSEWTWD